MAYGRGREEGTGLNLFKIQLMDLNCEKNIIKDLWKRREREIGSKELSENKEE